MSARLESSKYYEFLIRKIDHEDSLIHFRTQWSLTFQGFLFAAYSLVIASEAFAKSDSASQQIMADFLLLLSVAGVASAGVTTRGVKAALWALSLLKRDWEATYDAEERSNYPNPYLPADQSGWTFAFAYRMPQYLVVVWLALSAISVKYGLDHGSYVINTLAPTLSALFWTFTGLLETLAKQLS
ncbi:MAG: hypothetical protein ABL996_10560 [Micropepsaceae bacterium]